MIVVGGLATAFALHICVVWAAHFGHFGQHLFLHKGGACLPTCCGFVVFRNNSKGAVGLVYQFSQRSVEPKTMNRLIFEIAIGQEAPIGLMMQKP